MKRFFTVIAAILLFSLQSNAQKTGFLNMETILKALPEYNQAQEQLQKMNDSYKKEIETSLAEIEKLYNAYQAQKKVLTAEMRQAKENDIIYREREVRERQNSYFGQDGFMAKETRKLMDPINVRVQTEISRFAEENGYSLIIDIASNSGIVYKKDSEDLSQKIIDRLK